MYRNLIVIALVGLLAACATQGEDGTDQSNGQSIDTEPSMAASASAETSDDASAGPAAEASEACASAFATLEGVGVESLSDLVDVDGVDATIDDCESVADWIAGAEQLIENVNPSTAELLLGIQCDQPGLANTAICEEIASS